MGVLIHAVAKPDIVPASNAVDILAGEEVAVGKTGYEPKLRVHQLRPCTTTHSDEVEHESRDPKQHRSWAEVAREKPV